MKWAKGDVEREDNLLPYPMKVRRTLTTDVNLTSLSPHHADSVESAETAMYQSSATVSTAVPRLTETHDEWAISDTEESEAFWGCSDARISHSVTAETCRASGAVSEATDSEPLHSATRTVSGITQRNADCIPAITERSSISIMTEDSSNKNSTDLGTEAVSATVDNRVQDAERQMWDPGPGVNKIVNDYDAMCYVCETNQSSVDRHISDGNGDSDLVLAATSSQRQSSTMITDNTTPGDSPHVDVMCESDEDISTDPLCRHSDSEADTYVLDDTEDSDVDDGTFTASRQTWQCVGKKDPFPMKEHLLLSLEEVSFIVKTFHSVD